jgi:DNA-binding MarR family transcriptional regulator
VNDPPEPYASPAVVADIRRGAARLARQLRIQRPAGGLSSNKLSVLVHLNIHGPSSPKDIAIAEQQKPQSLTRSLAELEADGLVHRSTSTTDGRSSILSLSEYGREILTADMHSRDVWLTAAICGLSDLEVQILHLGAKIMDRIA